MDRELENPNCLGTRDGEAGVTNRSIHVVFQDLSGIINDRGIIFLLCGGRHVR